MSSQVSKMVLESPLSRRNCQMLSTGFTPDLIRGGAFWRQGEEGDSVWHVQRRRRMPARLIEDQHRLRALGDMARDFGQMGAIASVLHCGMTRPAATPRAGQIAPKIWAETVRRSFGAEGPVPRRAQRLVIPVFCPIRASCCHHRFMGVPAPGPARICSSLAGKFFLESAIAPASCA